MPSKQTEPNDNPLNIQTFTSRRNKKLEEYLRTNAGKVALYRAVKEGRIVRKRFELFINPKCFGREQTEPSAHLLQVMLYMASWILTRKPNTSKEDDVRLIREVADKLTEMADGWETALHMNQDEEIEW